MKKEKKLEQKKKSSTKNLVMSGMFAAVLAVLSQISIPMPSGVPVTLQIFAVALTGFVLGWKMGAVAVCIYVLIGTLGAPVFSGFSGGLGVLLGKTGGFLFGFPFMALLCGMGLHVKGRGKQGLLAAAGLGVCHMFGSLQYSVLTGMPLPESVMLVSVPYLVKDAISVVLAYLAGTSLRKALYAADIFSYERS